MLIRNGRQPKLVYYLINPAQFGDGIDLLFLRASARRKNSKMTMTKDQGQQFANNNDSEFQTMDDQNSYGDKMQSMNEHNQHQVVRFVVLTN